MTTFKPSDFEYHLLPGKAPLGQSDLRLHNDVYQFWMDFWSETLLEVTGERRQLSADDFVRQDYFAVLRHNEKVIGIHSYSFFNINSQASRDHSYFKKYFSKSFMEALSTHRASSLMTMEYFSIAKEWRGIKTNASLAKLMAAMGLRLAAQKNADGTVTAARADVPAAKMAKSLGAISLVEPIEVHGKPTELMLFPAASVREPEDVQFRIWLNDLWGRRIDHTEETTQSTFKHSA